MNERRTQLKQKAISEAKKFALIVGYLWVLFVLFEIHKITISLNLGDKLQVSQGLSETDQVIVNPSDSLANGMTVKILNQNQTSKE